ncbi:HEAT repeat domain-containing protein [Aeoliella mucimassa]|uniref:HEAT repeat protein n=1 Tax=Aeoliella mucimassa TaxID=2527972 RepID=A0A518ANV8_9BACT|nr:HEAT repeat domain-containing protein [Aeoliella mucimassa]QDU56408.1 HEAT repeat protein [Aeoliella mucimassa]
MPVSGFQLTLSTLSRTPNQSAADVLVHSIEEISPAVRNGAIAAFARRSDELSQRRLLEIIPMLSRDELAALDDLPRKLQTTLRKMIAEHDIESTRAACYFITSNLAFDEFPAVVTAACDPDHPGGDVMSSTALTLARALHSQIVAYRRAPGGRDPSFARRWALTSLAKAVDQFQEHRRTELLEAFLLITTPGNHTLTQLLTDPEHPAHDSLMTMLRDSPSIGAIELLAKLFEDPQSPIELLEIAVDRTDEHFRSLFLQAITYPISSRVRDNVKRLKRIRLLEKPEEDWFTLPPQAQAVALEMLSASRLSRRIKLNIFQVMLTNGAPLARLVCCNSIGRIELPEARATLEKLLSDSDPQIIAAAGRALRRTGSESAVKELASLLEHTDQTVRKIAKDGLSDFTFMRYVSQFDEMDTGSRKELGCIVLETDATAIEQLRHEITAASLSRKLRGMQMASAMGAVDDLIPTITKQTGHQDAAVRAEAALTLARSPSDDAREAIEAAMKDANALVRNRATQALRTWDSLHSMAKGPES